MNLANILINGKLYFHQAHGYFLTLAPAIPIPIDTGQVKPAGIYGILPIHDKILAVVTRLKIIGANDHLFIFNFQGAFALDYDILFYMGDQTHEMAGSG